MLNLQNLERKKSGSLFNLIFAKSLVGGNGEKERERGESKKGRKKQYTNNQ